MIVQCPECSSEYRVDDSKIPDSGGKISCPKCSNQFVVYPDDGQESGSDDGGASAASGPGGQGGQKEAGGADPDATSVANRNRLQQMAEQYSDEGIDEGAADDEEEEDATYVMSPDELPEGLSDDAGGGGDNDSGLPDEPLEQDGTVEMRSPLESATGEAEGETNDVLGAVDEDSTDVVNQQDVMDAAGVGEPDGGGEEAGGDPLNALDEEEEAPTPSSQQSDGLRTSVPDDPTLESEGTGAPGATAERDMPDSVGDLDPPDGATTEQEAPSPDAKPEGGGPAGGASTAERDMPEDVGGGAEGGVPTEHDGPWKLQAEHGLTYEFPETEALRNWLHDRDGVDSFELSADGSTFYPLTEFPQVADLVGGGAESGGRSTTPPGTSSGGGGAAPAASDSGLDGPSASSDPARTAQNTGGDFSASDSPAGAQREGGNQGGLGARGTHETGDVGGGGRPARSSNAPDSERPRGQSAAAGGDFELPSEEDNSEAVLYAVFVVLLLIAVGVGLDVSGTYPVGRLIPGVPTSFEKSASSTAASEKGGGAEAAAAKKKSGGDEEGGDSDEAQVERVIEAARDSIENNELQSAVEELQAAKLLAPKRVEIYEMLATVYGKLGKKTKAKKNRQRAEELRAKAGGAESGGAKKKEEAAAAKSDDGAN